MDAINALEVEFGSLRPGQKSEYFEASYIHNYNLVAFTIGDQVCPGGWLCGTGLATYTHGIFTIRLEVYDLQNCCYENFLVRE